MCHSNNDAAKTVLGILLVLVCYAIVANVPEMRRYLKIRSM